MKKVQNGNQCSYGFRQMIVNLYHSDQKVKDISSKYDVSQVTIYS